MKPLVTVCVIFSCFNTDIVQDFLGAGGGGLSMCWKNMYSFFYLYNGYNPSLTPFF